MIFPGPDFVNVHLRDRWLIDSAPKKVCARPCARRCREKCVLCRAHNGLSLPSEVIRIFELKLDATCSRKPRDRLLERHVVPEFAGRAGNHATAMTQELPRN